MFATLAVSLLFLQAPKDLTGHAGAEWKGKVYVSGGSGWANSGAFYASAWEVDPPSNKWTKLPDMRIARAMAASAALNGSIYVAGGFTYSGETLGSVERLDPRTMRWSECAPLRNPRSRFSLVALHGHLYALGGLGGSEKNLASIEEYDSAKNSWSLVGSLREARHGFAIAIDGDRILVFGGYAGDPMQMTSHCESWNTVSHESRVLVHMPVKRGFHSSVQIGRKVICFGGRPPADHPSIYDLAAATWIDGSGADLDINRTFSCLIGGRVWMIGGESRARIPIVQSIEAWR